MHVRRCSFAVVLATTILHATNTRGADCELQRRMIAAASDRMIYATLASERSRVGRWEVPVSESLKTYRLALGLEEWRGYSSDGTRAAYLDPDQPDAAREQRDALGPQHPYLAEWSTNQARIADACSRVQDVCTDLPAVTGTYEPAVQALAEADVRYQTALAHLSALQLDAAYGLFKDIAARQGDPWRVQAAYKALRIVLDRSRPARAADDKRTDAEIAYFKTLAQEFDAILSEKAFARIHGWVRRQQDVLAYNTLDENLLAGQLVQIARRAVGPNVVDDARAGSIADMASDLAYFIWPEINDPAGWWLRDQPIHHTYSEATRRAARRDAFIDWLQADVAAITSQSRTWRQSADYWRRPAAVDDPVPEHAWKQWIVTGQAIWLRPYARRVLPNEQAVQTLRGLVDEAAAHLRACTLSNDWAAAYPALIEGAVRVFSASGRVEEAVKILEQADELPPEHREYIRRAAQQLDMRRGRVDGARLWIKLASSSTSVVDLLLASNLATFTRTAINFRRVIEQDYGLREYGGIDDRGDFDGYAEIRSILDILPVRALLDFARAPRMDDDLKAAVIRTAWLRAWLLGKEDLLAEATTMLRATHPSLVRDLVAVEAASSASEKDHARLLLVLRNPGFNLQVSVRHAPYGPRSNQQAPHVMDRMYFSDGNWWCSYRSPDLRAQLKRHLLDRATIWIDGSTSRTTASWNYLGWIEILGQANADEVGRLAAVGNGVAFLSQKAIAWAHETSWLERRLGLDDGVAEALHLAVRTSRWSCAREAPHGVHSRAAFQLLHRYYADTPWAKQTKYWYDYPSTQWLSGVP